MASNLDQTGVMQVNGAWVTRIQYEAPVLGPTTGTVELRFMQGRAQVARTSLPRDELVGLVGERNARAIEKHVASDADKYLPAVKGELKGTRLHYREVTLEASDVRAEENAIAVSRTRMRNSQEALGERAAATPESAAAPQANDARASEAATDTVNDKAKIDNRTETQGEAARKKANRRSTIAKAPVPPHIASKYLIKNDTYYFDDQSVAFVDRGSRFTVQTHNKAVIQDLVEIAKARDWLEVTITGTESFRREAWKEAHAASLTVKGYTPSPVELAAADRERQRRSDSLAAAANRAQPEAPDADSARPPPRGNPSSGVVYGTLIAHNEAPYRHDDSKSMSYYLTLKGEDGKERTLWGVGLSDAIKGAQTAPAIGDFVGVKRAGSTPVNVSSRQVDANGEIIIERIDAKRHDWVIEKASYFKDNPDLPRDAQSRPSSNPSERARMATEPGLESTTNSPKGMTRDQEIAAAVRSAETTREELQLKYPELNKAVFQHLASHAQFAEAYVKAGLIRETDRMQVIAQMRERLANQIERGAPIKEPDNKQVNTLIRRSVDRVAADIGRAPVEIQPRSVAEVAQPKAQVRDEAQVRA